MEEEKSESTSSEDNNSKTILVNHGGSILNALNTGEKTDTEEATPDENTITQPTSVGEEHERSGLDVIMSITDTNGLTNDDVEVDVVTESNGMTKRCDVTHHQSNITQHSQATEDSDSSKGRESLVGKTALKQEELTINGSNSSLESLDAGELGTYLSRLWKFQPLTSDQERYAVIAQPQAVDDLELPPSLECQPYAVKGGTENKKLQGKDCLLNAGGKTPVAILHEYCQRVLKTKPVYLSSECENADMPFLAEVQIDEIKYGSGIGPSKKLARQKAAECTLEVLLPGVYKKMHDYQISEAELEVGINLFSSSLHPLFKHDQILSTMLNTDEGVIPETSVFYSISSTPDTLFTS